MATKKRDWRDEYSPELVAAVLDRDYANGGADAVMMNDEDYAATLYDKSLWEAADEAGRQAIHDRTEQRRGSYGYSGGEGGDKYIKTSGYQAAAANVQARQAQLDALTAQILGREPFSYDYRTDPRWQAYKKEYTREGQRAAADTLGQYAAMTGGMPSSAAVTASQQAGDYYAAQMADKIPELYKAAYDMYLDEGAQMRQNASLLSGQIGDAYGRARDLLGDERYADELAYARGRDALSDARYADETAYNRQMALAQLAANYGDYSGLSGLGVTPDAAALLRMELAGAGRTSPVGSGSTGSRGSTSRSGGSTSESETEKAAARSIYEQMYDAGVRTEDGARAWLTMNGFKSTRAGNMGAMVADYMAQLAGMGEEGGDMGEEGGDALLKAAQTARPKAGDYNQIKAAFAGGGMSGEDKVDLILASLDAGKISEAQARLLYKMLD